MRNFEYFVFAYLLLWLLPFVLMAWILWRTKRIEKEISELRKEISGEQKP